MSKPNILFLVLDAVRSDHLSTYGYERQTDPFLSTLADDALVFENTFANSNWTPTSHAAMFTGLLPSRSGVYGDNLTLPDEHTTIAEHLSNAGYRTFATAAGSHIRGERGFDRGFDEFHETYRIQPSRRFLRQAITDVSSVKQLVYSLTKGHDNYTYYKTDRLKKWISSGDEPFFAFLNFKTTHHPYNPPRPYKSEFSDVTRPPVEAIELLAEKLGYEPQDVSDGDIERMRRISKEYPLIADVITPTEKERATVEAWYDGAIRYLDARIKEIVSYLRTKDIFDNTYIVVTADHGEQFGGHGLGKHRYSLYDELLRVPLFVYHPSCAGERIEEMVSLIDLYPTLLSLAGIDPPARDHAMDIVTHQPAHEYVYAEVGRKPAEPVRRLHQGFEDSNQNGPLQSVRSQRWKLIRHADGRCELYNWEDDPHEQSDRSDKKSDIVSTLEETLLEELSKMDRREYAETTVDDRLRQQLEDMGYL